MPFLMLCSVLHDVALEADQDAGRVFVGAAADAVGIASASVEIRRLSSCGRLGQAALLDQERRLLLGAGGDLLGFFLGLLDDPLALGVDPLRGADLLGHGHAQLVDEVEGAVLVDDDVVRQRQLLAVGDQRLEPLDEEDDVDWTDPPLALVADRLAVAPDYGSGALGRSWHPGRGSAARARPRLGRDHALNVAAELRRSPSRGSS